MRFIKKNLEKRKYKRGNYYCLVKYRCADMDGPHGEVITSLRNVSAGGLLFKVREYLPVGMQIKLSLNIPPLNEITNVSAKVVRLKKGVKGYWIGAMFTDIKDEDKTKINNFVISTRRKYK